MVDILRSLYLRTKKSLLGKLIYKTGLHYLALRFLCLKPVNYYGFKVYCNPYDRTITPIILQGMPYEEDSINIIKKINKGDTVIDIGANIGIYTLFLSRFTGEKGKIYAFEPDPKNYKYLIKNVKANKLNNIVAVNKALGNKNGKVYLYIDSINSGANSLAINNLEKIKGKVLVDMVTLDDFFFKEVKNLKVDFIKSDAQGAEPLIFEGAKGILSENKDLKILMEFWPFGIRNLGKDPLDFLESLSSFDFDIYEIKDNKLIKIENFEKFIENIERGTGGVQSNWTNIYLERNKKS